MKFVLFIVNIIQAKLFYLGSLQLVVQIVLHMEVSLDLARCPEGKASLASMPQELKRSCACSVLWPELFNIDKPLERLSSLQTCKDNPNK